MSHRSHHREDHADDEDDDADGPQDRGLEEKTGDEENDSENDHGYLPDSLLVGVTVSGQCLKTSLALAPACLVFPLACSTRPSVRSRVLPVARPKYFLVAPLTASALWASFLPMLMWDSFVLWRLQTDRGRVSTGVRCHRLLGFGATRLCRVPRAGIVQHSDDPRSRRRPNS